MKFKEGDLVEDSFLGKGVIEKVIKGIHKDAFCYRVRFDLTPPIEYNNGSNPCLVFGGKLKKLYNA